MKRETSAATAGWRSHAFAAVPQHIAVSLRLTVGFSSREGARLSLAADLKKEGCAGKAEPYRYVLRQSREVIDSDPFALCSSHFSTLAHFNVKRCNHGDAF
ncbi:MAG: hypothetical protein AABM67_18000 [Acidobacteriota bacterium]